MSDEKDTATHLAKEAERGSVRKVGPEEYEANLAIDRLLSHGRPTWAHVVRRERTT